VPRDFTDIMPERIARLERDSRGYPIPWFVDRPADGAFDFRMMDPARLQRVIKERRCWVCGDRLGKFIAFVGGPLSAAQRLYSDPPSHVDCAEFSAKVCPFLVIPSAQRRQANKPAHVEFPGPMVMANPEIAAVLVTTGYIRLPQGVLMADEPREVRWFCEGRPASRLEVQQAVQIARERDEVKRHPNGQEIIRKLDMLRLPAGS
jgi:hypothetical protein